MGASTVSGTAAVSGFVRGAGGAPVVSAEVRLRGTPADARTDALGAFTLRGLPAGSQELEVRRIGYSLEVVPVELRSGTTTTANVLLRRIVNLDSMVIVASRPKYPDFYAHMRPASDASSAPRRSRRSASRGRPTSSRRSPAS